MNRTSPALFAIAVLILAACGGSDKQADPNTVVLRDYSCKSCRIVAESIALIGHPDDTVQVTQFSFPGVDSRNLFYLPAADGGHFQVFNTSGRLMQTIGKPGQGPGEFDHILFVMVGPQDSLLVFTSKAVHIISPEYKHVRQFPMPDAGLEGGIPDLLRDGSLLMSAHPNSFVRLSMTGDTLARVQLRGADTTRKCPECARRTFAEAASGGSVWSGTPDSYIVDQHSLDGELQLRFVREADWFKQWPSTAARGGHGEAFEMEMDMISMFTKPRLLGLGESGDGLLWTFIMFAEDVEAIRKLPPPQSPDDMNALMHMLSIRIEAIDIASRKLLVGATFKGLATPLTNGLTAFMKTDSSGDAAWHVVRLKVEGRQ